MSEKEPITPMTDQGTQETLDSGGIENEGQGAKGAEASENMDSVLSSENKSRWERFSDGAKKIANEAYEGLYKIPGVRRVVGKLEIAYKQSWIDRHQGKAIQYKEEMDKMGSCISECEASKKRIKTTIESFKSENLPIKTLQIELQKIDRESAKFQNKQDRAQSKFEARDNKLKLYTNERDRVADKLIERYEEKLKPMEVELERLSTFRDETDSRIDITEFRHKKKITELEKRKTEIEESLRQTNRFSEKKIRKNPAIKEINKMLADGREEMRVQKENLVQRKAEIDKSIAKVDAKANLCRDKQKEFIRVKEGRPIEIDVATRQKEEEFKDQEKIQVHSERGSDSEKERTKDEEQLQAADFIGGWNTFLKETYKNTAELIDAKDFFKKTFLQKDEKLDFNDFKNFLGKYLKRGKLPVDQFSQSIDKFFEQKVKVGKELN